MSDQNKINEFKDFVKTAPYLNDQVSEGKASWQELYQIWDLYGEDQAVWSRYQSSEPTSASSKSFDAILNMVKNVDLNSLEHNIKSVQKFLSVIQSFVSESKEESNVYNKRPFFKYFDD